MSTPKKRRPRPGLLSRKFLALGLFIAIVAGLTGTASAAGFVDTSTSSSFSLFEGKDKEIEHITQKLEAKKKLYSIVAPEIESEKLQSEIVVKQKDEAQLQLEEAKNKIARLESMFVNINRYAHDSSGNTYALGNCTWYVKSVREDISNSWGNANTWYDNAQAQGWNVGLTPKKGAVATTTQGWAGHVAYVVGVSLDGQYATIREMNYGGLYNMNTRTVHYSEFRYIYELN